jgi:hypothetical protein
LGKRKAEKLLRKEKIKMKKAYSGRKNTNQNIIAKSFLK